MIQSDNKVDIIITLPALCTKEEYDMALDICSEHKFTYFRFNLAKFQMTDKEYETCLFKCNQLRDRIPNAKIIIDLSYPRKRLRLFVPKNRVDKKRGDLITCCNKKVNDESGYILVDDLRNYFASNKEYIYQDGECCFAVKELKKDKVVFQCLNNFLMKSGKAIATETLLYNDLNENTVRFIDVVQPKQVWVSFVESAIDIKNAKKKLPKEYDLYAKIESQRGIDNIDDILKEDCNIVVARGDLGLSIDIADLYDVQQFLLHKAKEFKKRAYIATDFMTSMNFRRMPSRADVIDLVSSLRMGCNGIMLNTSILLSPDLSEAIRIINKYGDIK